MPERLLAPQQAVVTFFSHVAIARPAVEHVPLDDALGRVLASAVAADADYPAARRSAMDGFAATASATPGRLTIAGNVAMGGAGLPALAPGQAARIPTGGIVPEGADAVAPIEDCTVDGETVEVRERLAPGENVIPVGADMRAGEPLLAAGLRLGPRHLGLLATLGIVSVPVYRRPVVAVLSTGDELIPPGDRPRAGEIRDSNRYAIAASLRAQGADARHVPTVGDGDGVLERALEDALAACDAVVVTGGSSVGERDRLPAAVAAIARPGTIVHGLKIKPGKPALFGAAAGKPILGLPGNPTSALLVLEAVAAPIVAALCGATPEPAPALTARLAAGVGGRAGWTWYVPMRLEDEGGTLVAQPLPLRSFSVSLTARAAGYATMPESDDHWAAGSTVTVRLFRGIL